MSRENFCTRIHHFDQCWDSQILNNKMDTKWITSRIFGRYTSIAFQRAISGKIPTTGRHPKVACNQHYVFLHQHSPFLTSVGKVNFWTTKWTPNETNQAYLEIILPYISNEPSRAQFWHREGIQKWPTNSTMHFCTRIHKFWLVLGK